MRTIVNGEVKRTLKDLAKEALDVQDACNLSGVVHSFSRVITDLREIARAEGWEDTDKINAHPVCVLFADKIVSLTLCGEHPEADRLTDAYMWASEKCSLLPSE
jgi:hypothetical protein